MEFSIREATSQDYTALLLVFDEVDTYHRQALPHVYCRPDGPVRDQEYVKGLIADEDSALFVAEHDGQIAGTVSVSLRQTRDIPILVPRRYATVNTLAVLPTYRRAGIGRALMERAQRWARDRGASEIELSVWEFNAEAVAFYRRLGYETSRRVMSKSLPQ